MHILRGFFFATAATANGSFYKHDLTLIPAWISNYILYKVCRLWVWVRRPNHNNKQHTAYVICRFDFIKNIYHQCIGAESCVCLVYKDDLFPNDIIALIT